MTLERDAGGNAINGSQLIASAPAMARLAGAIWWRATRWGMATSIRTGGQLARAAGGNGSAGQFIDDLARELREYARDLLGVTELERQMAEVVPDAVTSPRNGSVSTRLPPRVALRVRGARLLRASAALDGDDPIHPAYARILTELAPDEARILRLLATEGAQPMVDVLAANLIGVGSQPVARGLTMIGAEAGILHRERVTVYLENLERLGLISFCTEPLDEPAAYQVLEAQPEVLEAIHSTSRAKTDQRSIELTVFGTGFCEACLPTETAELEALAGTELEQLAEQVIDEEESD